MEKKQARVMQRYAKVPEMAAASAYGKALKIIISADGEIAPAEWAAFQKGMQRLGVPPELMKDMENFDVNSVSLESVLPKLTPGGKKARFLLRDAIQLCRADGTYAEQEKAAVHRAAAQLGVDSAICASIEALVELEETARHLRKALLR